jgi:hypothetical protein
MNKVFGWMKNHKLLVAAMLIVLILMIFVLVYLISSSNGGTYGNRCKDHEKYKLSSSTISKVKKRINEIDEVNSIDIYTKLCTVKIIVNIKDDVDINKIKDMSKDILTYFSKKQLKYYDFALYVSSDNEESKTYPINVSKHKTSDSFVW